MPDIVPRVVFDTVVFVRGLINPWSVWGRLLFRHAAGYRLMVSRLVVIELLEVLARPEITRKFRQVAGLDRDRVIAIVSQAESVELTSILPVSRDPNDDKFLATARAARADYLVSEDRDLLVLAEYQGTKIINAMQFMQILEALEAQA